MAETTYLEAIRQGLFEVGQGDFERIAFAMGAEADIEHLSVPSGAVAEAG